MNEKPAKKNKKRKNSIKSGNEKYEYKNKELKAFVMMLLKIACLIMV